MAMATKTVLDKNGAPAETGAPRSTTRRREAGVTVPHLSVAERVARGKAARRGAAPEPRGFEPLSTRADPVELLERQAKTRVQELVPIRYGRMLVSPFTFYRGAAMIMAHDLGATPRSGLTVQCCGDAHLVELRRVRLARAAAGVRRQRFR